MRVDGNNDSGMRARAVAGTHAVLLAFDLPDTLRPGCLGFGIFRTDHTENEAYWLAGFKTFRSVVPHPSSTVIYPSDQQPVQGFWWGDYTAKPAHEYSYRIQAVYGTPQAPTYPESGSVSLDVSTGDPATGRHGVYFNRGVAASQAYATKFGAKPDDLSAPQRAAALVWLSRGLHEAMLDFVLRDAGPGRVLRGAVYEFTEPSILQALGQAAAAGTDVKVIYHASGVQGQDNEKAIAANHVDPALLVPRHNAVIAHNKFLLRGHQDADGTITWEETWTGSTNLSEGGIFGHSNVAHVVRDAATTSAYADYWAALEPDPKTVDLRAWTGQHNPFDPAQVADLDRVFSPRSGSAPLDWYATEFVGAGHSGHITLPFGLDARHFETRVEAMAAEGTLRFLMLNKKDDHQDVWSVNRRLQVAVGSAGGPDSLARWARETLTGFNPMVPYLHTKILLVDPMRDAPLVVSGSANFSPASTSANDENMLVVRGDLDLADVYLTEYSRIFNHFYARYWAARLRAQHPGDDSHSYLREDAGWLAPYFASGPKALERELYASKVEGNTP
jgi:hypothetical protein